MSDFLVVLLKISSMFLVMALGWVARKRALINEETGRVLSRLGRIGSSARYSRIATALCKTCIIL